MTLLRWLACLSCLFAALACAAPADAPIVVRDDRGVELRLPRPPQRIVSLVPSLTESVCALGGCARLVGVDRFSDWPPEVRALPSLGGLDDAPVERIVALAPQLVLASRSARVTARLQALGLPVAVFDSDSHADVRRSLEALAALLGDAPAAQRLWSHIESELTEAAARVPPRLRGKVVYFEVDATPYGASESSFIGQTLARLGLANLLPAALGPFPRLNPEHVVRRSPDIVMAVERNAGQMAQRPGWAGLRALREHQVCAFDGERYEVLVRPGPRMGEAAGLVADCLARLP